MRVDVPDFIVRVADRIIQYGTEHTTTGNYIVGHEAVADLISASDFSLYLGWIIDEVASREEILGLDIDDSTGKLDCNFALNYCPNYEWCDGDEAIFGNYEAWEHRQVLPVIQRYLSLHDYPGSRKQKGQK